MFYAHKEDFGNLKSSRIMDLRDKLSIMLVLGSTGKRFSIQLKLILLKVAG